MLLLNYDADTSSVLDPVTSASGSRPRGLDRRDSPPLGAEGASWTSPARLVQLFNPMTPVDKMFSGSTVSSEADRISEPRQDRDLNFMSM